MYICLHHAPKTAPGPDHYVGRLSYRSRSDELLAGQGMEWDIFFSACAFIGIFPLLFKFSPKDLPSSPLQRRFWHLPLLLVLGVGAILLNIPGLGKIIEEMPPTMQFSDIMPQIDVMVRRFFWEGITPYATFTDLGYPLFSPYMPLHWGPFAIPRALGFDFRWLALGVYAVGGLYFSYVTAKKQIEFAYQVIMVLLPAWFLWKLIQHEPNIFGHTVELLIAAYYLIMALTVMSKSPYLRALGLILCLLSRYTLALWIPLYVGVIFFTESRRKAVIISALSVGAVLFLYVFPFLLKDPGIFRQGLEHHSNVVQKAWTHTEWYTPEGRPGVLSYEVGLGRYFFDFWPGPAENRLKAITLWQLILSVGSTIVMGLLYRRLRQRIKNPLFLLLSLQLYLTFFSHLYGLPFVYYMMVPVTVSMVVVLGVFNLSEYGVLH